MTTGPHGYMPPGGEGGTSVEYPTASPHFQAMYGNAEDPLIYGDDIIVVDQSGAKTAVKRIIETMPILNMFTIY